MIYCISYAFWFAFYGVKDYVTRVLPLDIQLAALLIQRIFVWQ